MKWSIPNEDADPWYARFTDLINELDQSVYASREDRNLVLMGGGDISWTLSTSTLSWSQPIRVFSPISGLQCIIPAGSAVLDQDGKLLHAPLVRYPTGANKTLTPAVASQVPGAAEPNSQLLFAVRWNSFIYWRNGLVLSDGMTITDFASAFSPGGDLSGSASSQTVVGIQGLPVDPTPPTVGQTYKWDGSAWVPGDDLAGIISVLVFRPTGVQGGNVYTSWSDLMTEFAGIQGPTWIDMDSGVAESVDIPAGTWDLEGRAILRSAQDTGRVKVQLASGAVLTNPAGLEHLRLTSEILSTGYMHLTLGASTYVMDCQFTTYSEDQPVIQQEIGHSLFLYDSEFIVQSATTPVLEAVLVNGLKVQIYLEGFSSIAEGAFKGLSPIEVWLENTWASCSDTHPDHAGALTIHTPPSGAAPVTFVWAPGYVGSAQNVYDDWAELYTDLEASEGPRVVQFDDSHGGAMTVPAGLYDFGMDVVLEGRNSYLLGAGDVVTATLGVGVAFQNVTKIRGLALRSTSTTPVLVYTEVYTGRGYHLTLEQGAALISDATASAPVCSVPENDLVVQLGGLSKLSSEGLEPVFEAGVTGNLSVLAGDCFISGASCIRGSATTDTKIYSVSKAAMITHVGGYVEYVDLANKRERHLLVKGVISNSTAVPASAGAAFVDSKELAAQLVEFSANTGPRAIFRVVMATTSATAGYEAYMDLYDINGTLTGVPGVVAGSQMDTNTGNPPNGAPTPNALILSTYEVELTGAFFTGSWSLRSGVFEARVWIGTEGGGNSAICASAELIFFWVGVTADAQAPAV